MQTLTYSSNPYSKLNSARLALWTSKYMLGCANQEPNKYEKSLWMWSINTRRTYLRKVAKELRAQLPARKVYRIAMEGEASQFGFWERAHSRGQAQDQAQRRYKDFTIVAVEEVK